MILLNEPAIIRNAVRLSTDDTISLTTENGDIKFFKYNP